MARKLVLLIYLFFPLIVACGAPGSNTIPPAATPPGDETIMRKVSPILLNQVEMRQQQMKQPTAQRLDQMQSMGMNVDSLALQRVFIHLSQKPNETQIQDMRTVGVTVYLDSWIPPAGSSPTGFLLADMPVNTLRGLAAKDYVIKLETAERLSQPQGAPKTQYK